VDIPEDNHLAEHMQIFAFFGFRMDFPATNVCFVVIKQTSKTPKFGIQTVHYEYSWYEEQITKHEYFNPLLVDLQKLAYEHRIRELESKIQNDPRNGEKTLESKTTQEMDKNTATSTFKT
jgi:hypothetical protein